MFFLLRVGYLTVGRSTGRSPTAPTRACIDPALTFASLLDFFPRSGGGGGAGQAAKDATGADIKSKEWLKTHLPGDHTLSQGLKVRARDERPER